MGTLYEEASKSRMRPKVGQPFARNPKDTFPGAATTQGIEVFDLALLRRDDGEHPEVIGAGLEEGFVPGWRRFPLSLMRR